MACAVLSSFPKPSSNTKGISDTPSIRCPRAITRAGTADAAKAEATAYRFCVMLILRCQRRQILVGANIRPPRHMLPKAPWPDRWVPPPPTRGIRATARPVPHDSAEVYHCFLFINICIYWDIRTHDDRSGKVYIPGDQPSLRRRTADGGSC